jgi:hypothetical protein
MVEIELTVHAPGAVRTVTVGRFETVRAVLACCGFCPWHVMVIANRVPLQLDLSLAHQGIASGTAIHILTPRDPGPRTRRQPRAKSVYSERLRLADLSFLPFENGRAQRRLMLRLTQLADAPGDSAAGEERTNIDQESRISEEPLPTLCPAPAPGKIFSRAKRVRAALQ